MKGVSGNPNGRPLKPETAHLSEKDRRKHYKLMRKYGISLDEYQALWDAQDGVCMLCRKPESKAQSRGTTGIVTMDSLHVDHDHETGEVRGLLCYRCNTGIGKLWDDPALIRRAADYLEGKSV